MNWSLWKSGLDHGEVGPDVGYTGPDHGGAGPDNQARGIMRDARFLEFSNVLVCLDYKNKAKAASYCNSFILSS